MGAGAGKDWETREALVLLRGWERMEVILLISPKWGS